MDQPLFTDLVGWPVMHQYFRIDRARWMGLPDDARRAGVAQFTGWLHQVCAEEGLQFIPMAGVAKSTSPSWPFIRNCGASSNSARRSPPRRSARA